jgi:O-antigen biosynthesis protein WbqL
MAGDDAIYEIGFARGGNGAAFTISGWAVPEAEWTWTIGPVSRLKLPFPPARLRCRLDVMPFVQAPYLRRQRLTILAGDARVFDGALERRTTIDFEIPPDLGSGAEAVTLDLLCPDSIAPVAIGAGADPRPLGVACISLRIARADAAPAAAGPPERAPTVPLAAAQAPAPAPASAPAPAPAPAAPARYGGFAQPDFAAVADIAALCHGARPQRLSLFSSLAGPAQTPLHREDEFERDFVAEHYRYPQPPEVCVYALPAGRLWGNGVLTHGQRFFLREDCFPGYLRGYVRPDGHSFPEMWTGPIDRARIETLPVRGACGLFLHPNMVYGHFLLEGLPKLFLLGLLRDLGVRFKVPLSNRTPAWIGHFVRLFVPESDILVYDMAAQAVEADWFIVPSMMHTDHNFHPAFNLMSADVLRRAGVPAAGAETQGPRRIYLSRRLLSGGWHRLRNEEEVEAVMVRHGFTVVHPQTLSLREQFALMAGAGLVAGEYGSALHNTLFAPYGARVIGINCINWYQSVIGRLRRQKLAFVPPADGVFRSWRTRGEGQAEFEVDTGALYRLVGEMLAEGRG